MKQLRNLCAFVLSIAMIFSLVVVPASAANADYTIAENCSVTLVKDDNFKTDDTSVDISVKLDDRLQDCYMIIYAYAGNTRFDPDGDFNVRLWTGKVKNCTAQTFNFIADKLPLKVGNKIIATLNVPVGEDVYKPVNSQAIEVVDENGEGFKPYVYPDITIDETELEEGATSLHVSMTGDERIFEAAKNGLTEINYSIGMYPDGEDFDFEGENQVALYVLGESKEPFSGKEIKLIEPLRAGYRVRAVAYWGQNPDIYLPKGNDYDKAYNKKDDSVLIKAKPKAPEITISTPVYYDADTLKLTVSGDVPEGAMLLVKSYSDDKTDYVMSGGSFVANQFNVTAGEISLDISKAKLAEGDRIVAFLQSKGTVYAQTAPVTLTARPAFSAQAESVITSESDSVTYNVTAQTAETVNINIAKLCKINADGSPDADNPIAVKYGQSAGKITFDGLSGKLSAGDKICLVLIYNNGARTYVSDSTTIIKPVGADSVTIMQESFDTSSTKATVIVTGYNEFANKNARLFLTVGDASNKDDGDSREKIAQASFTLPGTYKFTFDSSKLKAGQTILAYLYMYNSDTDRTYYRYSEPVLIESAGGTPEIKTAVSVENAVKSDSKSISVKVAGEVPSGAMLLIKSYPASLTEFTTAGGTWVASSFDVKTGINKITVKDNILKAGEKVVVFLQNGGTVYAQSEPVTVTGDSTPIKPEAPTAFINAPKGITAGMTKTKGTITFDKNAKNISYKIYQFEGESLDEETAEVLSESRVYLQGSTTIPLGWGKLKAGSKLQLAVTADEQKAFSNVVEVLPSPDWGTPTATFNVSAVKTTDKTVSVTVNYADEYIAMGDEFFCDITVYQYDGKYTDEEFEKNELWENYNLAKRVGQLNKLYGDETRGTLTVTFKESAELKTGDRLIIKLRLPHTEWEGEEVDYLSASIPIIGENETIPTEKVVLYNISANTSKGARLRSALDEINVPYEEITQTEFNNKVGFVAGLDGYSEADETYSGKDYTAEFMLMCSLSETTLDKVLAVLNIYGVSIDHKAIVTETNKEWPFWQLMDEIADEHEVMQNLVKLNNLYKEAKDLNKDEYGAGEKLAEFEAALLEAETVLSSYEPSAEQIDAAYLRLGKAYSALTGVEEISGKAVISIERAENGKYTVTAQVKGGKDGAEYEYSWNNKQTSNRLTDVDAESLIGLKLTVTAKSTYGSLSAALDVPVLSGVTTSASKNSISVSWNESKDEDNIPKAEYYDVKLYSGETEIKTLTVDTNTAVLDGLSGNTKYAVTVTAVSPVGKSDVYKTSVKTSKSSSGGGGSSSSGRYTVKFDTNGGTSVKNISVKRGQTIGNIEEPKKDGFVFDGWYSDKKLTKPYKAEDKVTASMTLYASWKVDPDRQLILTIGKNEAQVFGETKTNDVVPKIVNDRTMLPARFVAENLGAEVSWDEKEQLVTVNGKNIKTNETVIILVYIGQPNAFVNGETVALDAPAFLENDRTYTPVRFISEYLGASVDWNETGQQVVITK